jgi:hypothetical protein
MAETLLTVPRHPGIPSGGMVLWDRPVIEVCPVECGRMPGRTVLQWDKDDSSLGMSRTAQRSWLCNTAGRHRASFQRRLHRLALVFAILFDSRHGVVLDVLDAQPI